MEHPFNLKGGYGFLGGEIFLSANLMGKNFLSLTWAEKNILKTLYALNFFVCKLSAAAQSEKKIYFDSEINQSPPPPFKLNGCSLNSIKFITYFIIDSLQEPGECVDPWWLGRDSPQFVS